ENYTAQRQQVKGTFKVRFEPPAPLGQHAHLAEFPRPQRRDPAGFAPVGGPEDKSQRFFGRHEPPLPRLPRNSIDADSVILTQPQHDGEAKTASLEFGGWTPPWIYSLLDRDWSRSEL